MSTSDRRLSNARSRNVDAPLKIAIVGGTEPQRTALVGVVQSVNDLKLELMDATTSSHAAVDNTSDVELLMLLLADDRELWPHEIRAYRQARRQTPILALVELRSADAVRVALRAGADEVLFLPLTRDDLTRYLVKVSEASNGLGSIGKGITCSLASVAGGVGVSSLTVALSFALRRITEKQVAVIDLGLQCSALSQLLDCEPEHTIVELVDPTSVVDSIRLESVFCKHESGLYLLAAPKHIEEGEMVSAATVNAVLSSVRDMFDFVLVDCGHQINESLVAAWRHSDSLFYVINQTVTSVRAAQRFIGLYDRLHLDLQPTILLNRFQSEHPITLEKIEKALHRSVAATIPLDDEAFSQLSAGDLATARNSRACHSIDNLARKLAGLPPALEQASGLGLLSYMRSAFERLAGSDNGTH